MMDDITSLELKQKLDNGESFVFIDVREPYEYAEYNTQLGFTKVRNLLGGVMEYRMIAAE